MGSETRVCGARSDERFAWRQRGADGREQCLMKNDDECDVVWCASTIAVGRSSRLLFVVVWSCGEEWRWWVKAWAGGADDCSLCGGDVPSFLSRDGSTAGGEDGSEEGVVPSDFGTGGSSGEEAEDAWL